MTFSGCGKSQEVDNCGSDPLPASGVSRVRIVQPDSGDNPVSELRENLLPLVAMGKLLLLHHHADVVTLQKGGRWSDVFREVVKGQGGPAQSRFASIVLDSVLRLPLLARHS